MEITRKTCKNHCSKLLSKLKVNGRFCDVTIKYGDFRVMAHKCVLDAATEYFSGMLMNDTYEANTGIIDFSAMRPEIVKQCVDFIYVGFVDISMELAGGLIDAAEMFQLPDLTELCVEFLTENIDVTNIAEIVSLSCLYEINALGTPVKNFLEANFEQVIRSDQFKMLDYNAVEYCYEIIQGGSQALEMLKWEGISIWTNADLVKRKVRFQDIFLKVNLQCLEKEFVEENICADTLIEDSIKSLQYIRKYFSGQSPSCPVTCGKIKPLTSIVFINSSAKRVYQYDLCTKLWAVMGEMPPTIAGNCSAVEYNSMLYVGDGACLYSFNGTIWDLLHNKRDDNATRYTPHYCKLTSNDEWVIMVTVRYTIMVDICSGDVHEVRQPPTPLTTGFFVTCSKKSVFVLGGLKLLNGYSERKTVVKLILARKQYSSFASMVTGRAYGAAISNEGFLYAMGGRWSGVEFFNSCTREWQILDGFRMQCRNVTAHLADKVYIFGGSLGTDVVTIDYCKLEIPATELQRTRRGSGDMGV